MTVPSLDNRYRDRNGELARKHGDTLVTTLRQVYGSNFAPGIDGRKRLLDVLTELDDQSLSQLIRANERWR